MEVNVGILDRAGRAAFALAVLAVALKKPGKATVLAAFAAGDVLGSAVSGFCPLYKLMGTSTVGKPF